MAEKPTDDRAKPLPQKTAPKTAAGRPADPTSSGEAPPKPKAAGSLKRPEAAQHVTPEERWNMIATAAYYRAEKRGFVGGDPTEDWAAAEAEIDAVLAGHHT